MVGGVRGIIDQINRILSTNYAPFDEIPRISVKWGFVLQEGRGLAVQIKRENYINVQGWMVSDLKLKGNELLIYAIIYGFSQDSETRFTGSLAYLAAWTNSTKQGVSKCIKSLCEKGHIIKIDKIINGVKFCEYYATEFNGVCNKVVQGVQQSCTGGMQQSCTNNIDPHKQDDNQDNKQENIPDKKPYGEFANVLLTDDELEKLKSDYSDCNKYIEDLSLYLKNNPKKLTGKDAYKSHYATIKTWIRRDEKDGKRKPTSAGANKTNSEWESRFNSTLI